MRQIIIKIILSIMVVGVVMMFAVFFQTSSTLADQPNFTKPYKNVKPTLGERPLLVLLLGPDDPRMWDQVNVYALKKDGYFMGPRVL